MRDRVRYRSSGDWALEQRAALSHWPRPNTRDTKGKLGGRYFAFWAKGEAKDANSKAEERSTTWNRG